FYSSLSYLLPRPPSSSPLFPYTTLFRSGGGRLRGEVEHGGIRLSGGHIVDDVGTGGQGLPGDSGAHRVDADHRAGGGELTDDGHDAAQLFVLIDADGPRPRRLASDIDDVGAGVDELETVGDSPVMV